MLVRCAPPLHFWFTNNLSSICVIRNSSSKLLIKFCAAQRECVFVCGCVRKMHASHDMFRPMIILGYQRVLEIRVGWLNRPNAARMQLKLCANEIHRTHRDSCVIKRLRGSREARGPIAKHAGNGFFYRSDQLFWKIRRSTDFQVVFAVSVSPNRSWWIQELLPNSGIWHRNEQSFGVGHFKCPMNFVFVVTQYMFIGVLNGCFRCRVRVRGTHTLQFANMPEFSSERLAI